jgi:hypothetical protein
MRHGPHHVAQKSTTTGRSCERWITSRSNSASLVSTIQGEAAAIE